MSTAKNLAIASVLTASLVGISIACGSSSDDSPGNSGNSGAGGGGAGTAGSVPWDSGGKDQYVFFDGPGADALKDGVVGDGACASETVEATLKPANILFVIDRTGSMNCNPPPTQTSAQCEASPQKLDPNEDSKWEITRDSLLQAMQGLTSTQPTPSVGLLYFNSDDNCGVNNVPDVAVAELSTPQLNTLTLSLNNVTPKGSTPIVNAAMVAYQYLWANKDSYNGNIFVVLLTDGTETCDPDNRDFLVGKAAEAASVGIRTFVLGAPGSEGERAFLSKIAYNGGTPSSATCDHSGGSADVGDCHMDMTVNSNFAAALQENLEKISGEAISCVLDVPKPPDGGPAVDPNLVNVSYTNGETNQTQLILNDESADCDTGWQYTDDTKTKIRLCDEMCATVKADNQAKVSIALGCKTQTVPK